MSDPIDHTWCTVFASAAQFVRRRRGRRQLSRPGGCRCDVCRASAYHSWSGRCRRKAARAASDRAGHRSAPMIRKGKLKEGSRIVCLNKPAFTVGTCRAILFWVEGNRRSARRPVRVLLRIRPVAEPTALPGHGTDGDSGPRKGRMANSVIANRGLLSLSLLLYSPLSPIAGVCLPVNRQRIQREGANDAQCAGD